MRKKYAAVCYGFRIFEELFVEFNDKKIMLKKLFEFEIKKNYKVFKIHQKPEIFWGFPHELKNFTRKISLNDKILQN